MAYYPPPPPPSPVTPVAQKRSGLAIASLVIGAANVLCLFALVIPPFVGLILGFLGFAQIRRGERSGQALAGWGIGLNAFFCLIAVLVVIAAIVSPPEEPRAAPEPAPSASPSKSKKPSPSPTPSKTRKPKEPTEEETKKEERRERETSKEPARETTQEPAPAPVPEPEPEPEPEPQVYYDNCAAARAAGAAPVHAGDPGYGPHLDRDGDGIGCDT